MKRYLFPALIALLAISCSPKVTPASGSGDIVILYDNDVHCAVDGYANMAALKADMKAENHNVAVVSSGDYVQGGSLGAASKGGYIVTIMNEVGYDYVTLGNHEFDYGIPRMKELTSTLKTTVLCCNLIDLKADKLMFKPYDIATFGKKKVAVIGAATPYSFMSSTPTYFQDDKGNWVYSLCAETYYDNIQKYVNDARQQGADYVVVICHLGDDVEYDEINSQRLAAMTDGIDVILDGHSHSTVPSRPLVNKSGKTVIMSSTGAHFDNIGKLTIRADGSMKTELVSTKEYTKKDPRVQFVIDSLKKEYEAMGSRVIGTSPMHMAAKDHNGDWLVRAHETNLGDFCADAMRVCLDADCAFIGGGSIRADLPSGTVTFNDIFSVFPFNNSVCTAEMKGQMLLDMLEFSVSAYPTDFGGFLTPSGVTFEFNPALESPVVVDINKAFVRIEDQPRRVSNVQVLDKVSGKYLPLDPEKTYTVGGTAYLLKEFGDGYTVLKDLPAKDLSIPDVDILERYIVEQLGGTIPQKYEKEEGRIKIVE